jgi:DNA repair exonuclease SbcCD ATPase subunit
METSEATQLLTWLEEERRRDKALLVELEKTTTEQQTLFSQLGDQIAELEDQVTKANAELAKLGRSEQALQRYKDEILLEVKKSEERSRQHGERTEKLLHSERQDRAQALAKLGEKVKEASRLHEPLQAQQSEVQRLNKALSAIKLQLEEALRERREYQEKLLALTQRLDRNDKALAELQREREDAKIRSESIEEKLKLLEGWGDRGTQQMADLQAFGERLREEQAQFLEQLRTADDRRNKQLGTWGKEMRAWRSQAEKAGNTLAQLEKREKRAETIMGALDELKTQLEQYRESLEHLQHTGEERQKQQLEEWRQENEMLWLRDEERWQQLGEENARRDGRIAQLWDTQITHLRRQVGELAKWVRTYEKRAVRTKKPSQ